MPRKDKKQEQAYKTIKYLGKGVDYRDA